MNLALAVKPRLCRCRLAGLFTQPAGFASINPPLVVRDNPDLTRQTSLCTAQKHPLFTYNQPQSGVAPVATHWSNTSFASRNRNQRNSVLVRQEDNVSAVRNGHIYIITPPDRVAPALLRLFLDGWGTTWTTQKPLHHLSGSWWENCIMDVQYVAS